MTMMKTNFGVASGTEIGELGQRSEGSITYVDALIREGK